MRSVSCKVGTPLESPLWYLDGRLTNYTAYKYLLASASVDLLYAVDFLIEPVFRQAFRFPRKELLTLAAYYEQGVVDFTGDSGVSLEKVNSSLRQALEQFVESGNMSEYVSSLLDVSEQLYALCPYLRPLGMGLDSYLASHNLPSLNS